MRGCILCMIFYSRFSLDRPAPTYSTPASVLTTDCGACGACGECGERGLIEFDPVEDGAVDEVYCKALHFGVATSNIVAIETLRATYRIARARDTFISCAVLERSNVVGPEGVLYSTVLGYSRGSTPMCPRLR